jgi:membrane associated rhomboid family serine protease
VSQPDLFVVCKNCGSEVSPYVTECPYCGQRVRKRAPKIQRGEGGVPRAGRGRTRLPRLRVDEIEGIAPDVRPYASMAIIAASLILTLILATNDVDYPDLGGIVVPIDEQAWRFFATPFVHENIGYQFVVLLAVGVFGVMLERRFGPVPVVLTFLLAGAGGAALATVAEVGPLFESSVAFPVLGANGAALGLVTAWLVDDRLALRRGDDRGNDLLGAYVFVAVLVLLSVAVEEANIVAAAGGAAVGILLGLILPLFTRRGAAF